MTSNAEITFGALPLLSPMFSGGDYEIDVCADGTEYGNPTATVAAVASMLMDGDRAQITRYGNREATLKLRIKGATLDVVAEATAAIEVEVNKARNALTWLPSGWSTASVFDVVYSELKFDHDDLAETKQVTRYFTLTLVCMPFARRAELSSVVASPLNPVPVETTIDACTSTTGWTGSSAVTASGGAVWVNSGVGGISRLSRAGAVALDSGEYVVIEAHAVKIEGQFVPEFTFDGVSSKIDAIDPVGEYRAKFYIRVSSPTFSTITTTLAASSLYIDDVRSTDTLPAAGSRRQRSMTALIGGTARTTADLTITAADGQDLGRDLLVYTSATNTIAPPLNPWRISGETAVPDIDSVSAVHYSLVTASHFQIPAGFVSPGVHSIVVRMSRPGGVASRDVRWRAWTGGLDLATEAEADGDSYLAALDATPRLYEIGTVQLPTIAVDTSDTAATVDIEVASKYAEDEGDEFEVYEVYLFNLDTGVLTWFDNLDTLGESAMPTKAVISSATLDSNRPSWKVGYVEDARNDRAVVGVVSPGIHQFPAGWLNIFACLPGAVEWTATIDYYERFRHHVPPLGS